jgi:GrpB-like predicted nucleotidyltransferase (UPF0157 family)
MRFGSSACVMGCAKFEFHARGGTRSDFSPPWAGLRALLVAQMIEIVPYRSSWPAEFRAIGAQLRKVLGDQAFAIHHIGSTSIPGLPAKDIVDVQVTVADLEQSIERPLKEAGFLLASPRQDHCPPGMELAPSELEKRLFKGQERAANIHVRVAGRFNQEYALLCRDYLRAEKMAATAYAEIKLNLARYFPNDIDAYYDIKDPVFDVIMVGATAWARLQSWKPAPSDA